jgi:hypothetical protein
MPASWRDRTVRHARELIGRVALVELAPAVTLDALHLASIEFLRARGQSVELATYDQRMLAAARTLAIKPAAI